MFTCKLIRAYWVNLLTTFHRQRVGKPGRPCSEFIALSSLSHAEKDLAKQEIKARYLYAISKVSISTCKLMIAIHSARKVALLNVCTHLLPLLIGLTFSSITYCNDLPTWESFSYSLWTTIIHMSVEHHLQRWCLLMHHMLKWTDKKQDLFIYFPQHWPVWLPTTSTSLISSQLLDIWYITFKDIKLSIECSHYQ